ncbi:hypothetical protein [Sphingobium amiense]|uniref:hypothetical protein n=1 Tax=Sphingobium amiense TaxID=135719 RepID=UPI000F848F55|nr:hypothetical protein [Sphingobium amiense]
MDIVIGVILVGAILGAIFVKMSGEGTVVEGALQGGCAAGGCLLQLLIPAVALLLGLWLLRAILT